MNRREAPENKEFLFFMRAWQWIVDYIIGPEYPSKEVCDYTRTTFFSIIALETELVSCEDNQRADDIEKELRIRRQNIAVFERMYPDLLKKIL